MTLPDMKAEDQSRIKKSGKSFIIYQKNIYFWYFSFHSE
jgi:hypothetical protein